MMRVASQFVAQPILYLLVLVLAEIKRLEFQVQSNGRSTNGMNFVGFSSFLCRFRKENFSMTSETKFGKPAKPPYVWIPGAR